MIHLYRLALGSVFLFMIAACVFGGYILIQNMGSMVVPLTVLLACLAVAYAAGYALEA